MKYEEKQKKDIYTQHRGDETNKAQQNANANILASTQRDRSCHSHNLLCSILIHLYIPYLPPQNLLSFSIRKHQKKRIIHDYSSNKQTNKQQQHAPSIPTTSRAYQTQGQAVSIRPPTLVHNPFPPWHIS